MTPRLRRARAQDAPALVDLLHQLGYADADTFIGRRLRELEADAAAIVQVAEVDGVVLGVVALHFIPQLALPGDFCRIAYLCVDERARSLGLGARLEAFAVGEARRRGCDRIELHSHARRVDAHRFYARQGYEESPKYLLKRL